MKETSKGEGPGKGGFFAGLSRKKKSGTLEKKQQLRGRGPGEGLGGRRGP